MWDKIASHRINILSMCIVFGNSVFYTFFCFSEKNKRVQDLNTAEPDAGSPKRPKAQHSEEPVPNSQPPLSEESECSIVYSRY